METVKLVGLIVGVVAAGIGVLGGFLSLYDRLRAYMRQRHRRGDRGHTCVILSRSDAKDVTTVTYLVTEDVFHFLSSLGSHTKLGARIMSVDPVGPYFKVEIHYPPGILDNIVVVKKKK